MKTHTDILHWLAFARLRFSWSTLQAIASAFGSWQDFFHATTTMLKQYNFSDKKIFTIQSIDWQSLEKDWQWCENNNCHIITCHDDAYPFQLKNISDAPPVLFVQGDPALLSHTQIAIVGSRNPSPTGLQHAHYFSQCLTATGFCITSGLALGIDGTAHAAALDTQGKTIAVCGAGLQHIYPKTHQKLAAAIRTQGALITEFMPFEKPKASHFPQRNRIISGLSLGVLVVEAAIRSGSLITARCAAEQGREVFAIPGSIKNPQAKGCHLLLRQGAKLVEKIEDILEELPISPRVFPTMNFQISNKLKTLGKELRELFVHLGYETTPLDVIIERSGLTASVVSSMLLALEMQGLIQSVPGGYARLL